MSTLDNINPIGFCLSHIGLTDDVACMVNIARYCTLARFTPIICLPRDHLFRIDGRDEYVHNVDLYSIVCSRYRVFCYNSLADLAEILHENHCQCYIGCVDFEIESIKWVDLSPFDLFINGKSDHNTQSTPYNHSVISMLNTCTVTVSSQPACAAIQRLVDTLNPYSNIVIVGFPEYIPHNNDIIHHTLTSESLDQLLHLTNLPVELIDARGCDDLYTYLIGATSTIISHAPYILVSQSNVTEAVVRLMFVLRYTYGCVDGVYMFFNTNRKRTIESTYSMQSVARLKSKPITVKLMCSWTTSKKLREQWNKMSHGNYSWNNIVTVDSERADYYVIINCPQLADYYDPARTLVFRMEPDTDIDPRWDQWYNKKSDFLQFFSLLRYRNNTEWHLGLNYYQLRTYIPYKTDDFSVVTSGLYVSTGHRLRIDFIRYMEDNGVNLDIWGRDNDSGFKSYRGALPPGDKNRGILPYRYHFIAENSDLKNYFTEKIVDCILGLTVCFYWGCSNINDFIDHRCYVRLPLEDFTTSLQIIRDAIAGDLYTRMLPHMKAERERILSQYSFYPRIAGYIHTTVLERAIVQSDDAGEYWCGFEDRARVAEFTPYTRCVVATDPVSKIKGGDIIYTQQLQLWADVGVGNRIILHDNVVFCTGFNDRLAMVYGHILSHRPDFDVLYIGYDINSTVDVDITTDAPDSDRFIISMDDIVVNSATISHPHGINQGGCYGYIISQSGAQKMLQFVSDNPTIRDISAALLLAHRSAALISYCVRDVLVSTIPEL